MWGGVILSKVENPALSSIPPYVKRDLKFEDICSALKENFGGAMKASETIMKAHENANVIPDPYTSSTAALKVLRDHYEILEHTERFISLSTDKNAASKFMIGEI